MKLNPISFNTEVICKVYSISDDTKEVKDVIVVLTIDLETAEKIIFRDEDPAFVIGKYKLCFKFDYLNKPNMITLFYGDNMYVMVDGNKFINEVKEMYKILLKIDSIVDQSTFDYKAAVDLLQSEESDKKEEVDDEGERYTAYI